MSVTTYPLHNLLVLSSATTLENCLVFVGENGAWKKHPDENLSSVYQPDHDVIAITGDTAQIVLPGFMKKV
jgi:hypothetical protein